MCAIIFIETFHTYTKCRLDDDDRNFTYIPEMLTLAIYGYYAKVKKKVVQSLTNLKRRSTQSIRSIFPIQSESTSECGSCKFSLRPSYIYATVCADSSIPIQTKNGVNIRKGLRGLFGNSDSRLESLNTFGSTGSETEVGILNIFSCFYD